MPGQQRFPQRERLTRRSQFLHVYSTGEKYVGEAFIGYWVRQAGQGRKMGCAVSRKVGGAVVRNRVKRYIREVYRKHREQLPQDVHIVVVARPAAAGWTYAQWESAIRQFFRTGDLLSG